MIPYKLLTTLRALVSELTSAYRYHAHVRYRVISGDDSRLSLQIVRKAFGFPDVLPISVWPGVPGAKGEPTPGSLVVVVFLEGDPTLPAVTHWASPEDPAWKPVTLTLDATDSIDIGESTPIITLANGALFAARVTDVVTVGPLSGTIVSGSTKVRIG